MALLKVRGLVKTYVRRRVVDGVDFEVHPGEIVGLLGPNGAGKTTSFRITCGMIDPDAGKVMLAGQDVTNWPMYRRAKDGGMGYLAQESSVFRKLSVQNNLIHGSDSPENAQIEIALWFSPGELVNYAPTDAAWIG